MLTYVNIIGHLTNHESEMLTIEEARELLQDRNLRVVSQKIGLHAHTLYRIAKGETQPSYETLRKLSEYLEAT